MCCAGYVMFLSSARQIPEALRLMEEAIARDPHYGPALAWAAEIFFEAYRKFEFPLLRQQVIDIAYVIVLRPIVATFPTVSGVHSANSKLRERITPYTVLFGMMVALPTVMDLRKTSCPVWREGPASAKRQSPERGTHAPAEFALRMPNEPSFRI